MKYLPGHYLLYPCLSNNSSTNIFGLQCRPHNFQNLWVDWEDASPEVSFRVITLPKLVVSPSMFAPGLCDHWGYLIRMAMVWTSGAASTCRHGHRCRDPLAPWQSIPWLSDQCRSEVQCRHTGTIPMFSVWLFHLGGQELRPFFSAPSSSEENEH